MRKLKQFKIDDTTFKVTIVDDNTKFYNNDTESVLTFETDLEHDQSLLYITNIDDGSVVTELVMTKTNDGIEYELPHRIIEHYGRWKGQIVFEKGDEKFSTTIFDFEIDRFLVTERPPTLVEIESLEKLRNDAKELMAELVTGWQALESSVAEVVERGNTAIDEINNANQALEEAEADRASAESARVSAEEQRKTDHANRSAELDAKADKKQEDWMTPTLLNGFTGDVRYRKTQFGHLEIYGTITSAEPINNKALSVFLLPSEYIPASVRRFEATENAFYTFKNAKVAFSTYDKAMTIYAGQGGSSWVINVSIPIN